MLSRGLKELMKSLLLPLFLMLLVGHVWAKPFNVLFILTDNQPASIMGAYGNPEVRTPNIDQLAAEGMLFNNAFAVNGMCSPTRATLMTGLMPSQHGVHNWLDDKQMHYWPRDWSAVAEFRTLPLTLRNRGYQTALIGKWHLGQPWQASIGYQHWVTFTDGHTVDFWNNTVVDNERQYAVQGQHIVDFFTDKAVNYIENYGGDKPFYLQLNYDGPYLNPPTNLGPAKNRHYQSYAGKDFTSFPRVAFNANVARQLVDPETPDFLIGMHLAAIAMHNDPATMANVASQNTVVDDGVGRVMAALKAKGLDKDTLVIYSSDQGNFYGQHGIWEHTTVTTPSNLYEAALNIPLIVRHPGIIGEGKKTDMLIGQYDLPVTILDYLGVNDVQLENSPGRSFANKLKGTKILWKDEIYYEQEESRGVRTPKYAYWKRISATGSNELYDMQIDPRQHKNLYSDPAYKKVIAKLDSKLSKFFSRYSDKKYDLWSGGIAKGSVMRPKMFQKLYGNQWQPRTDMLPAFSESKNCK
jgi:arylsulfatase A-like enzyme